jgi:hypothetical protein
MHLGGQLHTVAALSHCFRERVCVCVCVWRSQKLWIWYYSALQCVFKVRCVWCYCYWGDVCVCEGHRCLVLQWITVCFWGKVCLVLLLLGGEVCVCVCAEIILSIDWCPKIFYWMLTGFILLHRVLILSSLYHWLLHRVLHVYTISILIFRESWSTSFRFLNIRCLFAIFEEAFENGFLGLTDTKHKKRIVHRVLKFCLWNWRLYILISFIFFLVVISGRIFYCTPDCLACPE